MPSFLLAWERHFPIRYLPLSAALALLVLGAHRWLNTATTHGGTGTLIAVAAAGLIIGVRDLRQTRHALLRNYPVIGHLRFLMEWVRPEIRQYVLESDGEAVPFSRQQRSLVYQRSKAEPDKRPFGSQKNVMAAGYEWINHSLQPSTIASHDFRTTIGGERCRQPYSASLFNISAMSFGALSANAVRALNGGAQRGGFAHDTGEGSISVHHRAHGGDLVWEIGSGLFGCRHDDGSFNADPFRANATDPQVKLIELKLSQGAKPGHGGWWWSTRPRGWPTFTARRGRRCASWCRPPACNTPTKSPPRTSCAAAMTKRCVC